MSTPSVKELRAMLKGRIPGVSKMSKPELVAAATQLETKIAEAEHKQSVQSAVLDATLDIAAERLVKGQKTRRPMREKGLTKKSDRSAKARSGPAGAASDYRYSDEEDDEDEPKPVARRAAPTREPELDEDEHEDETPKTSARSTASLDSWHSCLREYKAQHKCSHKEAQEHCKGEYFQKWKQSKQSA